MMRVGTPLEMTRDTHNRRTPVNIRFRRVRRRWFVLAAIPGLIPTGIALLTNSEAMKLATREVSAHPETIALLGTPVDTGFPTGSIELAGDDGVARLKFAVEGPSGRGMVFADARNNIGQWPHAELWLLHSSQPAPIDLLHPEAPTGRTLEMRLAAEE